MTLPLTVTAFPVQIPKGFLPDPAAIFRNGKICPGYDAVTGYRPRWGGGFNAIRWRDHKGLLHRAIDIMAPQGALVCSPTAGKIISCGLSDKGGNHAFIRTFSGHVWYFAHMRGPLSFAPGESIEADQPIGIVGRTGNAAPGCPHLHLSLTDPHGKKLDSVPLLRPLYDLGKWERA